MGVGTGIEYPCQYPYVGEDFFLEVRERMDIIEPNHWELALIRRSNGAVLRYLGGKELSLRDLYRIMDEIREDDEVYDGLNFAI